PAGQNVFLQSPVAPGGLADIFSTNPPINIPRYALTTAGDGPIKVILGGNPDTVHPSHGHFLRLNNVTDTDKTILSIIAANVAKKVEYEVSYNNPQSQRVVVGNVVGMYYADPVNKKDIIGVELNTNVPDNPSAKTYDFKLPQTDYVGKAIASLWYTW